MVHGVEVSDLHEPGTDAFHDLAAGLETFAPVRLPFEEVAWVEGVGAELEDAAELAGGHCWPEGELLHQRCLLRNNQGLELVVELGKFGTVLDRV